MRTAKSLLLGTAACLAAATAGQAADLPVKAKPVEYVKVCNLYGAGFYYMPGTDMCLKVGGWLRAEAVWGNNGTASFGAFNANVNDRATSNMAVRARGYLTADAREQTAYGVARAYIAVGIDTNDVGTAASEAPAAAYANRAYVQWAGFTAGLAKSFYDFYSAGNYAYRSSYLPQEDSSDGGWWVWAYTAQFGGGFSATISMEERRMNQIIDQTATTAAGGTIAGGSLTASTAGNGYGGWQAPDIIGNLRVDQTWGSAQVMVAAHEVNALYYSTTEASGHPSDQWGWVAGAGIHLNLPMVTPGDVFEAEVNYTVGALKYLYHTEDVNMDFAAGSTQGFGVATDCVYGGAAGTTGTGCDLTTGWSAIAAYDHYWTPQWHQSLVGSYMNVRYGAEANNMLCALAGNGTGIGTAAAATPGCNNNWSYWGMSSRLQWDVTKTFYVGVEVLYSQLISGTTSDGLIHGYALAAPAVPTAVSNESNWAVSIRMHKDFLP